MRKINAYTDLAETLKDVDAILFVVPTKVTRLVAQQVAETLDHKAIIMHASKGLEPDSHKRLSTILEEEFLNISAVISSLFQDLVMRKKPLYVI